MTTGVSSQASGASLVLQSVTVTFPDAEGARRRVLDLAAFALTAGTQVAVCGPSGSGKTTLVDLLAGLRVPDAGDVLWDGRSLRLWTEPARDRWRRAEVGLVFQQFHLFPALSVQENVLLPARFRSLRASDADRRRALFLLDAVGVPPQRAVRDLSRGEMQRVALARALFTRPRLVLADEPTASLDRATARRVGDLMRRLCRDAGATLVVATHDQELAATMDSVFDIVDGRLAGRMAPAREREPA